MNFIFLALLGAVGIYAYNKSKATSTNHTGGGSSPGILTTLENDLGSDVDNIENEFTGSNSESTTSDDDGGGQNNNDIGTENDGGTTDGLDSAQDNDNG
jgi:hypothetical protein